LLNSKKKDISITFLPQGLEVTAEVGERLVAAARGAGMEIETPCGGHGTCGGCAIRVVKGDHAPSACDRAVFDNEELSEGLRLSCQIELKDDLVVDLTPQREGDSLQILTHGLGREA